MISFVSFDYITSKKHKLVTKTKKKVIIIITECKYANLDFITYLSQRLINTI